MYYILQCKYGQSIIFSCNYNIFVSDPETKVFILHALIT